MGVFGLKMRQVEFLPIIPNLFFPRMKKKGGIIFGIFLPLAVASGKKLGKTHPQNLYHCRKDIARKRAVRISASLAPV
jgi:hypothetical protein